MGKNNSTLKVLRAQWVVPMSGAPIKDAYVLITGNIIENIVSEDQLLQTIAGRPYVLRNYDESIILPGFINLHTHLEHTNLKGLAQESEFLEWLPSLMEATKDWSADDRSASARRGIQESLAAGTTFVVDISYNGASAMPLVKSGLRAVIGLEIFGVNEDAAEQQWQQWLERYESLLTEPQFASANTAGLLTITVSPHAPYTVCPSLWQKAKTWSQQRKLPILTHLAESKSEHNWFESEDNGLKQFLLYAFGKRTANFSQLYEKQTAWKSQKLSPVEHLYNHNLLTDNLLAAHAVHIDDADINLLKEAGVSIAHCPNSNVTLKCGRAPLEKLFNHNVQVGLGTDSAASSNNLDLLAEANFATKLHHRQGKDFALSAKQALELITIKAAQCLGLSHKLGSLEPGKLADITIFDLPKGKSGLNAEELYEAIIEGSCTLQDLIVDGEIITSRPIIAKNTPKPVLRRL